MKTRLLLTLLTALSLSAMAQKTIPPANQIVIGQIDSLQSTIMKEKRMIWVHVPKSYVKGSSQRYPVVYLMDGDDHFSAVVGMIDQLSTDSRVLPEMIVVSILQTDRMHDLTPTVPADSMMRRGMPTAGGGEAFTSFLETELMPYVNAHYPTNAYKLLIGHSLGGLIVINALIHHPALFNAYVAIDPSMWWDNRKLLNEAKTVLFTHNYAGKALFMSFANTMQPSQMDTLQVQKDTTAAWGHIKAILDLHHLLKANPQNGLRYKGSYYANESHGSVPTISEYNALRFLFDGYAYDIDPNQEFASDDTLLAQKFANHYATLSKRWGFTVAPPEEIINGLAHSLLATNRPKKAEGLFKLNLVNYPKSPKAYDGMGDYYATRNDTANAISYFQQALALKESPETRKKLTELQAKKAPAAVADKPKK